MRSARGVLTVATLVLALGIAGCGADDDQREPTPAPTNTSAPPATDTPTLVPDTPTSTPTPTTSATPTPTSTATPLDDFVSADGVRGGKLYDQWWVIVGAAAPTTDHPLWETRPDQQSNNRTGAETWRCKECHGWDYKGADGAYATGSHATGFPGIFGTTLSAQEVFDEIKDDHGFGAAGLSDAEVWNLTKFVLEEQIETDNIIDANRKFTGSAAAGQTFFDSTCALCHGSDGLTPPPGAAPGYDEWPGKLANENPWEFQHKVRFGQPGTIMPAQAHILTTDQVSDLSAYVQTLPTSAGPLSLDVTAPGH